MAPATRLDASPRRSPTVAVVIITYNRPKLLLEAVASVLSQEPPPVHVVVVDDGSPLPQDEELFRLAESGRITLIQDGKIGILKTRNRGARATDTDLLLFLDDDDALVPGALDGLARALEAHPEAVAVAGAGRRYFERTGLLSEIERPPLDRYDFPDLLAGNPFFVGAVMMRRPTFDAVGGFEENLQSVQDWDMWLRVAKLGPIVVTPVHAVNYRVHAANSSATSETCRVSVALAEQYLSQFTHAERAEYGPRLVAYVVKTYAPSQLWHVRVPLRRGHVAAAWRETRLLWRIGRLGMRCREGRHALWQALRGHVRDRRKR